MIYTKFHHLSNDELTRLVSSEECSQLEIELAQRLEEAERENLELANYNLRINSYANSVEDALTDAQDETAAVVRELGKRNG